MYPYTITTLKPRCTGAFSYGICLRNIYHNIYHDGISMVHVQKTYTIPQTLCTSAFRRGDGIWVYVGGSFKKKGKKRCTNVGASFPYRRNSLLRELIIQPLPLQQELQRREQPPRREPLQRVLQQPQPWERPCANGGSSSWSRPLPFRDRSLRAR